MISLRPKSRLINSDVFSTSKVGQSQGNSVQTVGVMKGFGDEI